MNLSVSNGLVLHLETDSGITTSGGVVTAWNDASASGNNLVSSGDPAFGAALTPSGAPAISFDGVGDRLERLVGLSGLPQGNQDRTVYFVVRYIDHEGVSAGISYGANAKNKTFGLVSGWDDGDLEIQGNGKANDIDSNVPAAPQGWIVQSVVLSASQFSHYLNGTLIDSGTHTFATELQRLLIGGEIGDLGESKLDVGAVLVYDRALSAAEQGQVETYLESKYLVDDGLNNTPIAVGDVVGITPGTTTTINVLANDIDDAPLNGGMISIVNGPAHGTITGIDPTTGAVTYAHGGGGLTDSFTYTLTDANGAVSNPATVTIDAGVQPLSLAGFTDEMVITRAGMNTTSPFFLPISMAFLPDNRMLLLSKDGAILIVDPESGASSTYMTINNISSGQERGLLDITLDPNFATNGYFYLYYTPNSPANAEIVRFQHQENAGGLTSTGSLASASVIWQDTDGYLGCCHYGGGLDFGPDGKLWLTTSDKFQSTTPGEGAAGGVDVMLDLNSSSGKIIRVNPDGSVPDGSDGWAANPWSAPNDGGNDYVWAYGLRNPFRARWDIDYGQMFIGEVGGNQQNIAHDDVHLASLSQGGAFYGWPFYEGTPNTYVNAGQSPYDPNDFPQPDSDIADTANGDFYSAPIWSLDHMGVTASLTGGEVYRGDMFPSEWDGVYFYGDYTRDYIRYLLLDPTGTQVLGNYAFKPSSAIPGTTNEVVSIAVGNDGALYYAMIASGEVRRIVFDGNAAPAIVAAGLTPLQGPLPLSVTFTATVTDAENDALTYVLNFGDGTVVNGNVTGGTISVEHLYQADGAYNVSLSLSDPTHTVLSQPFQVNAGDVNFAPEITGANSDVSIAGAGTTDVNFTAMATDPDNDAMTYIWHFGDGTQVNGTVAPSGTVSASHIYATEGSFDAFLEVSDGTLTTFSPNLPIQVGTATQVPVTNGLVLLLQSDIKIGLGQGTTVVSWLDGSGRGNNLFAQGDPQLLTNQTPTGQSAIVFDGTGDLLQRVNATDTIFNLPTGSADRTMFIVVDYVDPEGVSAGLAYGNGVRNKTFGLVTAADGHLEVQGYGTTNDIDSGLDGVAGGFMVQSVVLSNNLVSHYRDGVLIDSESHVFATDLQKLVLGAEIKNRGEAQMKIAAVLIYDRALTASEQIQIGDFLSTKYIGGSPNNAPPNAVADSFVFIEDTQLVGNVLTDNGAGPDSDPDGDPLSVSLVSNVANGNVALNADGSFTYTPALNFNGADSFVYRLSDGQGGLDDAVVSLTGTPVNDPAVAVNDSYNTNPNTQLVVNAANGVLANDSDPEGDVFTAALVSTTSFGALALAANGSFTYTPTANYQGPDSFVYQVTGGATATATIGVGAAQGTLITAGLVAAYQSIENVSLGVGNTVTGWLDGSGRGNDLLAAGDPTLVANATPTGKAAIVFDGTGDLLQRVNATDTLNGLVGGAADRTMFFVVNYVDREGVSGGLVYGSGAQNKAFGLVSNWKDGDLAVQGWGKSNDFDSNVPGQGTGWMVQSVVLSGNVTMHYRNGTQIDSDTHVFNTDLQKLVIGGEVAGLGEPQIEVAGAFIYDHALTNAERMDMEMYLQHQYIDQGFLFA